jgi:L-asparagine transporter-like permease
MPHVLKAFSLVGVVFVYLLIALTYALLRGPAQGQANTGFERLGSNHWLVAALLVLIVVALVELMLRSPTGRRRRQAFWGGVFVGVGVSVCFAVDPGLGVALAMAGGCLANFNGLERTGAAP